MTENGRAGRQSHPVGRLLRTYTRETWFDGTVSVWSGSTPVSHAAAVTAAITFLQREQQFVLVDVRSRGWDLPGGHLENNETPVQALEREISEETGIPAEAVSKVEAVGWIHLRPTNDDDLEIVFAVYRANANGDHPLTTKVPEEIREVRTFTAAELRNLAANRIWQPFLDSIIGWADPGGPGMD